MCVFSRAGVCSCGAGWVSVYNEGYCLPYICTQELVYTVAVSSSCPYPCPHSCPCPPLLVSPSSFSPLFLSLYHWLPSLSKCYLPTVSTCSQVGLNHSPAALERLPAALVHSPVTTWSHTGPVRFTLLRPNL